jgi:hypothetical protein
MSKKRSAAELDALASTSIEFEFRMLICQVREFLVECPNELFGAGLPNCRVDALLEAWLVHIRLIDEFFCSSGGEKTAKAVNWEPDWSSQGILTPSQRRAVSAQVAHIGWDRKRWTPTTRPPWEQQVRAWTTACCRELERFIATIPTERRPAFEKARSTAQGWLKSPS